MAHHNSTPASVLDAPTPNPQVIYPMLGFNRAERRHGLSRKHTPQEIAERKAAGANVPYRKPITAPAPVEHRMGGSVGPGTAGEAWCDGCGFYLSWPDGSSEGDREVMLRMRDEHECSTDALAVTR